MPRHSSKASTWEESGIQRLLENNRNWSADMVAADPQYFQRLKDQQSPDFLWIGCADSRVPANQVVGLNPGEMFVQRNVGNQVNLTDMNCMACLEYAVMHLGVKHIIVSGHYGCGAVRAALTMPARTEAMVNYWIQGIRDVRDEHNEELLELHDLTQQVNRLCELNVMRQTFNVCNSPIVQSHWDKGKQLSVHGVVYSLENGRMTELAPPVTSMEELEAFVSQHEAHKVLFNRVRTTNEFNHKTEQHSEPHQQQQEGNGAKRARVTDDECSVAAV